MSVRCDGYQDCFDRSDEINCTTLRQRGESVFNDMDCTYPDRLCKANGNCVRVDKLCDGAYSQQFFFRLNQLAIELISEIFSLLNRYQ